MISPVFAALFECVHTHCSPKPLLCPDFVLPSTTIFLVFGLGVLTCNSGQETSSSFLGLPRNKKILLHKKMGINVMFKIGRELGMGTIYNI